jgi:hypothetical protein
MLTTMTSSVEPEATFAPASAQHGHIDDAFLTNAELVPLRIRVIALEWRGRGRKCLAGVS